MYSKSVTLLLFSSLLWEINGYKILGVFPFASISHYYLGNELMKGLAESGHDVTMLTVYREKNPPNNGKYKQIIMDEVRETQLAFLKQMTNLSEPFAQDFFSNPFMMIPRFHFIGLKTTENILNSTEAQNLIKSNEKFDIVIVPQFVFESIKAFATCFDAHLVLFANGQLTSWINNFVGNVNLPSLNCEIVLGYPGLMNFQQRLINTLYSMTQYITWHTFGYPQHNSLVHKYISKDIDIYQSLYNVSLILINSHYSLNKPLSSVPVMKEIGGFHVKPPKKLPNDLQKYLDEATEGVIYFSMGSNLKGSDIPVDIRNALLKAFSKRKEKILWKFETDDLPGKSANIKIEKWLPQSDILAHPNVKLFITHGGFLSTIETVYHGVPTIALPIFGDQLNNAKTAESFGFTVVLDFKTLTEELISSAIEEVLSNPKYIKNVKHRSQLFHDRPSKPLNEAIYWIEYIAKYNGANHLRVDYINLTWYQWYLLDVFGFMLIVTVISLLIVKKLFSIFCCKSKQEKLKKN